MEDRYGFQNITIIHRSEGGYCEKFTEAAKRRSKYPPLASDTEVSNCFSTY